MILKTAQSSNCFTFQYLAHFLKFQISKTKQPTKNGQVTITDRRVIWWMREMEKDIERQRTWGAAADSVSHCLTVHHWRSIDSSRLVTAPVLCRTASWQGWDDERLVRVDICITGAVVVVVESGMSCWADTAWYWEPLPGLVRPLYSPPSSPPSTTDCTEHNQTLFWLQTPGDLSSRGKLSCQAYFWLRSNLPNN